MTLQDIIDDPSLIEQLRMDVRPRCPTCKDKVAYLINGQCDECYWSALSELVEKHPPVCPRRGYGTGVMPREESK